MKILVKMGNDTVATFDSIQQLGQHYSGLADAFDRMSGDNEASEKMRAFHAGKAAAYGNVAWQLGQATVEE